MFIDQEKNSQARVTYRAHTCTHTHQNTEMLQGTAPSPSSFLDISAKQNFLLHMAFSGITKEQFDQEFNQHFQTKLGVSHYIPTFFIDTYPDWDNPVEKNAVLSDLHNMKKKVGQQVFSSSCLDSGFRILLKCQFE